MGNNKTKGMFPSHRGWWTWWHIPELMVVFVIGVGLMQYIYSSTPDAARGLPVNLPGNDSFYHVKMAMLLPTIGLPEEFPWLRHTIFERNFVSHHYGFHVYLAVFVHAFDDPLIGARWAMSVSFGLVLAVAQLILMGERIALRWLWLAFMLMLPTEFYSRHSYVRAIDLSLLCMLVGCFFMFRRRYFSLALLMIGYTHIYLGSVFLVCIAGIHFLSGCLGPRSQRDLWRLPLAIGVGGAIGLATHPYGRRVAGFLLTQIFGSGLTPEISVGREWLSYDNVWQFANLIGIPFCVMAVAVALRFRRGGRLTNNEWTMLITSFLFLGLVIKARRFIEYFPMFATLTGAMLAGPLLGRDSLSPRPSTGGKEGSVSVWIFALLVVGLAMVAWWSWDTVVGSVPTAWQWWAALGAGAYALAVGVSRWFVFCPTQGNTRCAVHAFASLFVALVVIGTVARLGYPLHERVRSWSEGKFDLDAVQEAMAYLSARSEPGDILFTDDWDIFPVFFYYNHTNHYVAGLDPMFSYRHDPELWERYKVITRGQAPVSKTISVPAEIDGRREMAKKRIHVSMEDIRDRFGARFVIVDADHKPFARKLSRAKALAKRIYPDDDAFQSSGTPPYTIYEILEAGATDGARGVRDAPIP